MKIKQFIAYLLLLVISIAAFGGYGGGSNSSDDKSNHSEPSNSQPDEPQYVSLNDPLAITPDYEILTPELIAKANSKPKNSASNHPVWTGFIFKEEGYQRDITFLLELSAQFGFNSSRVMHRYTTLFSSDASQAKIEGLEYLDKIVAKAIEHDMHLDFMFLDLPDFWSDLNVEDFSSIGEFDLFINTAKQAQANAITEVLAKRYKEIPSSALSFSMLWECGNTNRSTGLPGPEPDEEYFHNVGKFIASNISAIRAIDNDRLIFVETGISYQNDGGIDYEDPSAVVKSHLEGIDNIIYTYNLDTGAYLYAGMNAKEGENIDDNNHTSLIPEYPKIWYGASSVFLPDYKFKIDGFLPKNTIMNLHLRETFADNTTLIISANNEDLYQEVLMKEVYNSSLTTECQPVYAPIYQSEKVITVNIPSNTSQINIICSGDDGIEWGAIELVMPEEYAVERWYYRTAYDEYLGLGEEGLFKKNINNILISPNMMWNHLPEDNITIHENLTYSSEAVRAEGSPESVKLYGENCARFNNDAVIRYEAVLCTTWESEKAYYEDVLKMFAERGFSWFSNDWFNMANDTDFALTKNVDWPAAEAYGYKYFNVELLKLLQKYQSKDR